VPRRAAGARSDRRAAGAASYPKDRLQDPHCRIKARAKESRQDIQYSKVRCLRAPLWVQWESS